MPVAMQWFVLLNDIILMTLYGRFGVRICHVEDLMALRSVTDCQETPVCSCVNQGRILHRMAAFDASAQCQHGRGQNQGYSRGECQPAHHG